MNHLFSTAALLIMLPSQNQNLPGEFYQIPERIRETATLIVSGIYGRGRTPCMLRPDGSRVWLVDSWFATKRVYRGEVGSKFIRVNTAMLPKTEYVSIRLEQEREYLVLLRPGREKLEGIKTEEGIGFWEALKGEEIIAIVRLK